MSVSQNNNRIYRPGPSWYDSYRRFIHRCADRIRLTDYPVVTQLMAETLATIALIFYGDGSVAQKFFFSSSFLEISLGWGAAVAIGIVVAGGKASPAFMNPAVAVANAVTAHLRWSLLPLYIVLEVVGAFLGAALLLAVYNENLLRYVTENDGGNFYVNSTGGIFVAGKGSSVKTAVVDQILTTALLMFGLLAVGDNRLVKKSDKFAPMLAGMVVYMAVGTYTANASSALNPARDLGPRILLLVSYWGMSAFTIDNYYFWVPALMPIVGAVLGVIVYQLLIGLHASASEEHSTDEDEDTEADKFELSSENLKGDLTVYLTDLSEAK
ncbi:Aquaporin-3 [Echinococcus granulosus]|uniref:Aquaporin 9 AQP 9 Small solute channel 1 n=1 Tax=Echinococcus granulosus TaxID=6210 RepID=U6JF48_ECHGR|nr:Aquaporin-3 [Echinococcus granulosus]EUB62116.1 Aquaporin-3 [Echinococcus granulosus]KAH9285675.1 Aquaporin-3 [Echinococcus granulosus]CDS22736.1 Aquaporin 9 AQP 9 Small solute channel 1 [Echinococcus granulosus]